MIYKVEGDILLSKAQAIVHGVGINDPMDKGLALALHNKYPRLQADFDCWSHQHHTKPGEAWLWVGQDNARVVNLITHERMESSGHIHYKATIGNIKHALSALVKLITREKLTSIAVPRLGTGSGDLEWDDVWWLLENHLGELDIPVYLYVAYHPGQAADESGIYPS